jgi:starch synthase
VGKVSSRQPVSGAVKPLRIFNVCAEFVPLAKAGGLGDVTSALSRYLSEVGHDVVTLLPRYGSIDPPDPADTPVAGPIDFQYDGETLTYSIFPLEIGADFGRVFAVECPALIGEEIYASGEQEAHRFLLLSRAALELCRALDWSPDVVHCHDWHTALTPALIRHAARSEPLFVGTSTVLTIHNIGYQGVFPVQVLRDAELADLLPMIDEDDLARDEVNFLKTGLMHADALTTVSPTHAKEIRTAEYGMGLESLLKKRGHRLQGILNGVDYALWDPASDKLIETSYSADAPEGKAANKAVLLADAGLNVPEGTPVLGMISRLVLQKGVDLFVAALTELLAERPLACVVLGTGEPPYTDELRALAAEWPERLAFIEAYDDQMAHRILAGSDILVVPSRYEPCGLTQMYALKYGTVPVVRKTGGLADSIHHFDPDTGVGNGGVFEDADVSGLVWGLTTALDWYGQADTWARVVDNGMREDHSWQHRAPEYEVLYRKLTRN